jgi:cytochrome c biogenesis factor
VQLLTKSHVIKRHFISEFEVIEEKNGLEEKFEIIDNQERELFAHLQAKINMLHEKTKSHTRQWGIISTIIGALLGVVGTSISAYYRNNEIRRVQQSIQVQFEEQVAQIKTDTQKIMDGYTEMMKYLQQFEVTKKHKEPIKDAKPQQNKESWAGYFGRKTVAVWRWCTFQKTSS